MREHAVDIAQGGAYPAGGRLIFPAAVLGPMEPPLSIERFAALNAEMDAGSPRDEVLARARVSPEDWKASQQTWLSRLAAEVSSSKFDLTNRYGAAFMARRQALEEGGADGGGDGAAKPEAAPAAAPAPVAPPPIVPPPVAAPPVAPPPPVAAPPPPPAPAQSPWINEAGQGTGPVDPSLVRAVSGALPFRAPTDADVQILSKPSSPAAPPPRRPQDDLSTTTEARMSPFAVLPFQQAGRPGEPARPAAAPPPRPPAPPPPARPAPSPGEVKIEKVDELNMTADARMSPFAVMPFQGASAPPKEPRPDAPQPAAGLPFRSAAPASAAASAPASAPAAGSASASASAPAPAPAPARAPASADPGPEPRLTLEQFAALAAEIAADPGTIAQVRARYHLTEEAHRAEAAAWQRRFAADPALFSRYSGLFQHYRGWFSRGRR